MRCWIKVITFAAALSGLATVVLGLILFLTFPISADLPEGFQTSIIAFEFAKIEADLTYMAGDSSEARLNRQKMKTGMQWDMVFPIAYAGLLALLLLELAVRGHSIAWLGVVATTLIYPFDINENLIMLEIISALDTSTVTVVLLNNLQLATWLKWGAIAAAIAILSVGLFKDKQFGFAALAGVTAISILVCWLSGASPVIAEIMSGLLVVFFLSFAIKAGIMAWRELKLAATKEHPVVTQLKRD